MFSHQRSTYILWAVMALPGLTMIGPLFGSDPRAFHGLLHPTGEWAARLMIVGMMASGLLLLFRGRQWPRWLLHHRRDIEVAAFAYAALHTIVYVIDRGSLARITEALPHTYIWTGWLAFLIFVPLAITSTEGWVRRLGPRWKPLQRCVYGAAVLTLLHWAALHDWGGIAPALVHCVPLALLEVYRVSSDVRRRQLRAA